MARRFRLIDHTADTGLFAYGKTLPDTFSSAAFGMFSIMTDLQQVKEIESREVRVHGTDVENLLFTWLNWLLYLFDTEMLLLKRFDINTFDEKSLTATCCGEKFDPARHKIKIGVKSATYYLLEVDKTKNRVRVIFDI